MEKYNKKQDMLLERNKVVTSKYLEKTKSKDLDINLSNSFNKNIKYGNLKKSFGKVKNF